MWYKAQKVNNLVEIDLFDEIGGWGVYAKDFKDEVNEYINSSSEELLVNINSPGGSVFEGIEIYNYLKGLPNKVTVKINALAASIATVIALGADELEMSESAFFMIHNPWSMAMGEADDMRKQADVLDKIKETILSIYEKNSNLDRERLTELMNEETWLTGSEALEYGFATRLTEGVKVAAMATTDIINKFKNIPKELNMAENTETTEQVEEVTNETTEQVTEQVEETTEEVTKEVTNQVTKEVDEDKGILSKVKAFLSNKIETASNELQERYAEISNEVKELKELNADLSGELEESKEVLADSLKVMNDLKAELEAKNKQIEELNAKLSETETEELKPIKEVTNDATKKSQFDIFKELKSKK